MVDLHAHLPQLPNAGLGAGLELLTWLERYIYPLEREFDEAHAELLAPPAMRAFAILRSISWGLSPRLYAGRPRCGLMNLVYRIRESLQ